MGKGYKQLNIGTQSWFWPIAERKKYLLSLKYVKKVIVFEGMNVIKIVFVDGVKLHKFRQNKEKPLHWDIIVHKTIKS